MPLQFGSSAKTINREAKLVSLPLLNLRAVTQSVNFALTSEVTDGVTNATLVPKGTSKVLSCNTRTEELSSARHLRYEAENKAPQRAKSKVIMTSLSKSSSTKSALRSEVKGSSLGADSGAYAASTPKGATRVLSREEELKHYAVLIASAVMQRTRHRLVLRFHSLWVLSPPLQIEL